MVLRAAVVPERDRVRLPLEAAMQFRRLDVAVEHLQYRVALLLAQLHDAGGEGAVDEQCLAPGHRMGADQGMLLTRVLLAPVFGVPSAVDMLAVVDRGHAFKHPLDRIGQRLVGTVGVGEHGIASAVRRYLREVQDRAHRWLGIARHVRMPFLAGDPL
jgi:hypothetical protein